MQRLYRLAKIKMLILFLQCKQMKTIFTLLLKG